MHGFVNVLGGMEAWNGSRRGSNRQDAQFFPDDVIPTGVISFMFGRLFDLGPDTRELTNDEAATVYEKTGAVFVDVREQSEWDSGHMPGATHIPLGDLPRRAAELPAGSRIITVCRSGYRSLDAVDILRARGFSDVKSMAGGMLEWVQHGRAVE